MKLAAIRRGILVFDQFYVSYSNGLPGISANDQGLFKARHIDSGIGKTG